MTLYVRTATTKELVLVDNSGNALQAYTDEQCLAVALTTETLTLDVQARNKYIDL